MKNAAICTIGDEILIGQIVDTNSSHIAQELNSIGVKVEYMSSIGDDHSIIIKNLKKLINNYDIIIVTGGLGPTKDDITKKALGELFGSNGTYTHNAQLSVIKEILTVRGIEISDINLAQADVPNGCEVIVNKLGTAPCMVFRFNDSDLKNNPTIYSLPGVPFEAIGLLPDIMTDIKSHNKLYDIYHKTVVTFGIPESTLAKMIEKWENSLPSDIKLAYLPNPIVGVRLRLSIYGGDEKEEKRRIREQFDILRTILSDSIYGEGSDSLQSVIGELLIKGHKTLSVAESCTGGKIASLITSVPGASKYFTGSIVSYDNRIKEEILGVDREILIRYGAVSKECVEAMAIGVRRVMKSDYSLSTTGIAGPDGGSKEKPVGTIWIAVSYLNKITNQDEVISRKLQFNSDRERNIERFSSNALNLLRLELLKGNR